MLPSTINSLLATARSRQLHVWGYLKAHSKCKARKGLQGFLCLVWSTSLSRTSVWAFWRPSWPSQVTFPDPVGFSTGHHDMKLQEEAMGGSSTGAVCVCRSEWQCCSWSCVLCLWISGVSLDFATWQAKLSKAWDVPDPALFMRHCQSRYQRSCSSWAPGGLQRDSLAAKLLPILHPTSFSVLLPLCIRCCDTGQRQSGNAPTVPRLKCTFAVLKGRAV